MAGESSPGQPCLAAASAGLAAAPARNHARLLHLPSPTSHPSRPLRPARQRRTRVLPYMSSAPRFESQSQSAWRLGHLRQGVVRPRPGQCSFIGSASALASQRAIEALAARSSNRVCVSVCCAEAAGPLPHDASTLCRLVCLTHRKPCVTKGRSCNVARARSGQCVVGTTPSRGRSGRGVTSSALSLAPLPRAAARSPPRTPGGPAEAKSALSACPAAP